MRVNLNCPYAEKDEAKALGARWDPTLKTWYIQNAEDITLFMKWIRGREQKRHVVTLKEYLLETYNGAHALTKEAAKAFRVPYPLEHGWATKYACNSVTEELAKKLGSRKANKKPPCGQTKKRDDTEVITTIAPPVETCGCANLLPWEDCEHTAAAFDAQVEREYRAMMMVH